MSSESKWVKQNCKCRGRLSVRTLNPQSCLYSLTGENPPFSLFRSAPFRMNPRRPGFETDWPSIIANADLPAFRKVRVPWTSREQSAPKPDSRHVELVLP